MITLDLDAAQAKILAIAIYNWDGWDNDRQDTVTGDEEELLRGIGEMLR